jgi:NAD-dependent dihydropyrimidine dehydrogenase PreA subunit
MAETAPILFCKCIHRDLFPPGVRERVFSGLVATGRPVTVVDDLCELAANQDASLRTLFAGPTPTVVACYPRAVRWLLHLGGVEIASAPLRVLNMRAETADAILAALGVAGPEQEARWAGRSPARPPQSDWVPWFPVIDYDRCVNCRQCVSFCPFGVYTSTPSRVLVTNPRHCKDNCPACARACPQQAIVFPKVPDVPINGAEVTEALLQAARERLAAQQKELAAGRDIHSVLAQRKLRIRLRTDATSKEIQP